MELADLLVSYKQVKVPKREQVLTEVPTNKYQNMLQYIDEKKAPEPEQIQPQPIKELTDAYGFSGWMKGQEINNTVPVVTKQSSWSNPYSKNRNQWIRDLTNSYRKLGLSDNAIKNLVAKNALESGWGRSAQGAYNYGNITTGRNWKRDFVNGSDTNAKGQEIQQKFRSYNSMDDFAKDEVQFLTKWYDFNSEDNFDQFITKLQGGNSGKRKYAEANDYITKVRGVYNSLNKKG